MKPIFSVYAQVLLEVLGYFSSSVWSEDFACLFDLLYELVNVFAFNTTVTIVFFLSPFFAVILFCMAALIFPIGFYINEVGGQPYKLPNNTVVGSSYVLFVLSIFFTIVGLLFAGKVCLPG